MRTRAGVRQREAGALQTSKRTTRNSKKNVNAAERNRVSEKASTRSESAKIAKVDLRSTSDRSDDVGKTAKKGCVKSGHKTLKQIHKDKTPLKLDKSGPVLSTKTKNLKTTKRNLGNARIVSPKSKNEEKGGINSEKKINSRSKTIKSYINISKDKSKAQSREDPQPKPENNKTFKSINLTESIVEMTEIPETLPKSRTHKRPQIPKEENVSPSLKPKSRNNSSMKEQQELRPEKGTVLLTKLRTRRMVKYAESSLELSQHDKSPEIKKVPIYKRPITDAETMKRKGDQYEFDSDSEKYKKHKRRKLSDSDEYNETIKNIVKNVVNKVKVKKQKHLLKEKRKIHKNDTQKRKKETNNNIFLKNSTPKAGGKDTDLKLQKVIEPEQTSNLGNDNHKDADDLFGFTDAKSPKKVHIISDVVFQSRKELNLSLRSPTYTRPNANSTILTHVLTPWRFNDINIRRNPHFLTLKDSSLPCISQEPVLDHSIVNKLESSFSHIRDSPLRNATESKVLFQKSITDYFDANSEDKENRLFDCDQLSPIKNTRRVTPTTTPVKRRVLGEKNESQTASTPVQNLSASHPVNPVNLDTNFGFDSIGSSDATEELIMKDKDNRPFRLSVNVNDKKYKAKRARHIENWTRSPEASDEEDVSDGESEPPEFGLFEDLNDRRAHLEISDAVVVEKKKSKDLRKNRKRKDVRTKEEEEEAEKWAMAFNSMCEEIEQFPLEVE